MKALILALVLAPSYSSAGALVVDAAKPLRTLDRHRLLGSNIAGWFEQGTYDDKEIQAWIRDLGPVLLRLPGGSWGDGTLWNGNGVRHGNTVDYSKLRPQPFSPWSAPWGTWDIDYTGYAPGFLVNVGPPKEPKMSSTEWHGHVDVKTMHDYVQALGAEPFVIVNAGTGSPRDAAEWVRWANLKMGYKVKYWEVGNELEGSWEGGHFLPDGSELNGEIFARRYEEFARAMKTVDPTIKVGCMDWVKDVLARCGNLVDFISIHTYPVQGRETDEELFAKLDEVHQDMEKFRALIHQYQPEREKEIQIDYSEWSMGWPDIRGALWHAGWVGEMFRHGTDFATEFHAFDMMPRAQPSDVRLSIYWAFWLWSHCMGDTLVASELQGLAHTAVYATKSQSGMSIMVINQSAEEPSDFTVTLDGFMPASLGQAAYFTSREYFWLDRDPGLPVWKKRPATVWNTNAGPSVRPCSAGKTFRATVPPDSIVILGIPEEGKAPLFQETKPPEAKQPRLGIRLPDEAYAGDSVEGWVYAQNGEGTDPYPRSLPDAAIRILGPAKADRPTARLSEAAGHFFIKSDDPGSATVEVEAGKAVVSQKIYFKPSVPQPHVFWEFEEKAPPQEMHSHWKLTFDDSVRANQRVARVDLGGDTPQGDNKRQLLMIEKLPEGDKLDKKNIRGAFCDIKTSTDFQCDDPEAFVQMVMQSPMNWWMPLGTVKLSECKDWKTVTFLTDKPDQVKAMPAAFNIWFIISSKEPVHGSVCLDHAGLMVR